MNGMEYLVWAYVIGGAILWLPALTTWLAHRAASRRPRQADHSEL